MRTFENLVAQQNFEILYPNRYVLLNNVQLNMITQNSPLHNLLTLFQDLTQKYIAKSVLMVAPHANFFIEFLQMGKTANYTNTTVIIITIM